MADKKISEETILTKDGTEIIPVIQSDGSGGWINGALPITDFSDGNIYTNDGALPSNREVDLATFILRFVNGTFTLKSFSAIPDSIDPSSIFDIRTIAQGVRIFPPLSTSDRNGISPVNGLMIQNTDISYPEIYHPVYGWQPIGYGEIRIMIDFSETPLNSGNSWTLEFNTSIPSNKIIHKLVCVGTSIPDPSIQLLYFGMASQDDYFSASPADISDVSGTVSSGNSMRTSVSNEAFKVRYGPLGAEPLGIDSGQLEILILHT